MEASARNGGPVGLVLAGGGARGAYEIGALSTLLPQLDRDERPQIVVGTSVGAVNCAYLAAQANEAPELIAAGGTRLWGGIDYRSVLEPLVWPSEGVRLASYVREVLGSRRARTDSVLDPAPLTKTLRQLIAFDRIHPNVVAKHLMSAAVVATSGHTSKSVVFHDGGDPPLEDVRRGIFYVNTQLTENHVRASAAIPLLFPAVAIDEPGGRRWYFDGGTRLNTPIKPALALGAERVIVIALNSLSPAHGHVRGQRPDALDGATQLIQAVLVDPLVNDVHTLATVNELLHDSSRTKIAEHENRTRRRRVPYMLIAPEDPDEIGRVASEVYRDCYGSPRALVCAPNVSGLGRLLNASKNASHGELLSYLLFAKAFTTRLIELGQRDAQRWLDATHQEGRWQVGKL
ncbi:MAG: patatin-like phospholipase family protein [Solirubrobacteraceae bacterium]